MDIPPEPISRVKIHLKISKEDLPRFPAELKDDFGDLQSILACDPCSCDGLVDSHDLERELAGCRAMEFNYLGEAYRLVYRIFDSPETMWVDVISFSHHDDAYNKAKQRAILYKKNSRYYKR